MNTHIEIGADTCGHSEPGDFAFNVRRIATVCGDRVYVSYEILSRKDWVPYELVGDFCVEDESDAVTATAQ